jgi:hypothetical protein
VTPAEAATAQLRDVMCTFSCRRMLFILGMVPRNYRRELLPRSELDAAAAALAGSLAREVHVIDGELLVELDEPVEAIVAARDHDLYLQRCIASGSAIELLREPGAPAQAMWAWLCGRLAMPDAPYPNGLVKLGIGRTALPTAVEEVPERSGVLLWILQGGGDDRLIFVEEETTIGRARSGATATLALHDTAISAEHCAITRRDGAWTIEDIGSLSGTFVEGGYIQHRRLLPGMMIRAGTSLLVVLAVR